MPKALIIAEKPSVANDLAKVLGKFKKEADYYENDEYVISSAVGHLLELCLPEDVKKKHRRWSFESLPIIPDAFDLAPIEKSKPRLAVLKKLINRPDIDRLINACDAGREGELIFRYIVRHCKTKKPSQRLWLQSMTADSIRDGFAHLRPGTELEPLAAAAVARSESDWLIGINGTRALTALNSRGGGFILTTVGRVQTPTLALMVERDLKIREFQPRAYWELHGTFQAKAGSYPGRWFDEKFTRADKGEDEAAKPERLWDEEKARAIERKCAGKPGIVTEERKPTSERSPLLYDLTSLQREANGRFGLSAKRTLQVAQALYEKHKVLTYPRTDSRYLPEDYLPTVQAAMKSMKAPSLAPHAQTALKSGWVKPDKRIFNNAKVSDHFAIIPTDKSPDGLDEFEFKVYEMVAKRFLAVFFPPAQFEVVTRITRVEEEPFKTEGKVLREPGWLAIYGKEAQVDGADGDAAQTVPVEEGEKIQTEQVEVRAFMTKPPPHYSEATLLSAMEGAGKLVEDEALREAMGKKGLGTPATRAAIIEGLIAEKYVHRDARDLLATPKAFALIELLNATGMPVLTSPEMTGEWEYKLGQIERGELKPDAFAHEITDLTRKIVDSARGFEETEGHAKEFPGHAPDGRPMIETMRYYQTKDSTFRIGKYIAGRFLESHEALELLEKRFLGPLTGFRSRLGRPFAAALKLNPDAEEIGKQVEFVFEDSAATPGMEAIDVATAVPVGKCPVDGARVFEGTLSFICEHGLLETPTCKFKIGKKILGQDVTREQAEKILSAGKSDLLNNFVSNRTKRRFSAYLVSKDGKVGFEFEPRDPKKGPPKPKRTPFAKGNALDAIEAQAKAADAAGEAKAAPQKPKAKVKAPAKKSAKKSA